MTTNEQAPDSGSTRVIEDGETYDHAEHGRVEVTGIWQRTRQLEMAYSTASQEMVVVRHVPADGGDWIDEQAEELDDFLAAIR